MKTNRRDLLKTVLAAPAVALVPGMASAEPEPELDAALAFDFHKIPRMEQIAVLPSRDGNIVSMVQFQDEVYIATEFGTIYCLSGLVDRFRS